MKHTEGKWRLTDTFGGKQEFIISDGKDIAQILSGNIEDARLIASAPELLEACKFMVKEYESNMGSPWLGIQKIKETILKAEGK